MWLLELPRCWVEYSDNQLTQIANAACMAIGYSGEGPSQLWFLLGLLAPTAEWCINLLVGTALMVVALQAAAVAPGFTDVCRLDSSRCQLWSAADADY